MPRLLNVQMPADAQAVEADLLRLVGANGAPNCTLRLVVVRNGGGLWEGPGSGRASDTIALTADTKQWGESVRLGVQPHARYAAGEFTGAKILSWAANLRWYERAQEQGLDEMLLLNERDRVAECTSANVFAVFGGSVLTPPLERWLPSRGHSGRTDRGDSFTGCRGSRTLIHPGGLVSGGRSFHHIDNARFIARTRDRGAETRESRRCRRTPGPGL